MTAPPGADGRPAPGEPARRASADDAARDTGHDAVSDPAGNAAPDPTRDAAPDLTGHAARDVARGDPRDPLRPLVPRVPRPARETGGPAASPGEDGSPGAPVLPDVGALRWLDRAPGGGGEAAHGRDDPAHGRGDDVGPPHGEARADGGGRLRGGGHGRDDGGHGDPEPGGDSHDEDAELTALQRTLAPWRHRPRAYHFGEEQAAAAPGGERGAARAEGARGAPASLQGGAVPAGSWWANARRAGPGRRRVLLGNLVAAAAIVLLLLVEALRSEGGGDGRAPAGAPPLADTGYSLEMVSGRARIERGGEDLSLREGELSPGDRLVLGEDARGRLAVGRAGSVVLEPGSRLAVHAAGEDDEAAWRLYLERGELTASIFAAPRLFQVGTPSGIAVDLGCFYTARVDPAGVTTLAVRGGRVAFEAEGRQVFVPAGARVVAHPGRGPGTPVWEDAPLAFTEAVARLDRLRGETPAPVLPGTDAAALALVLEQRDATSLTLWHLLGHPWAVVHEGALLRLLELAPPPDGLPRAPLAAGDRDALDAWREHLDDGW